MLCGAHSCASPSPWHVDDDLGNEALTYKPKCIALAPAPNCRARTSRTRFKGIALTPAPTLQGEYIAPEKVEAVYGRSPFVAQAFVYGDSLKPQLVAVVVPDPDTLLPWAAERGLPQQLEALCQDAAVAAAVLRSMRQEGGAAQLKGFEQVRSWLLVPASACS